MRIERPDTVIDSDLVSFESTPTSTIYVDITDGDDSNPGTLPAPLKTFGAAKDAVLALAATDATRHYFIRLAPGDYSSEGEINFNNANLQKLTIIGEGSRQAQSSHYSFSNGKPVVIDHITATNNPALVRLEFDNLEIDTVWMDSTVNALNLSEGMHIDSCVITNDLRLHRMEKLYASNSDLTLLDLQDILEVNVWNVTSEGNIWFEHATAKATIPALDVVALECYIANSHFGDKIQINKSADAGVQPVVRIHMNEGTHTDSRIQVDDAGCEIYMEHGSFAEDTSVGDLGAVYMNGGTLGATAATRDMSGITFTWNEYNPESNILYVDSSSGNDSFNGTRRYPVATLTQAIARAETLQTADPSEIVTIYLGPFDYSTESIVIGASSNIARIRFVGVKGVTKVDDFQIEGDDITRLELIGIEAVTSSLYGLGPASSNLGWASEGIFIKDCAATSFWTWDVLGFFEIDGLVLEGSGASLGFYACAEALIRHLDMSGATGSPITQLMAINGNGDTAITSSTYTVRDSEINSLNFEADASHPVTITLQNVYASTEGSYDWGSSGATSTLTLGPGTLFETDGSSQSRIQGTFDLILSGGMLPNWAKTPTAPAFFHAGSVDFNSVTINDPSMVFYSPNLDVDIGTEVVDSFPETIGDGAIWDIVVKDSAGTALKTSIIVATWDQTTGISFSEQVSASIGDTSDLTLDVVKTGDIVELRATAVNTNNWDVKAKRRIV